MKFLDGFLAMCAFALSTIMTATLYVTFIVWAYGALGPSEHELIAAAIGGPPAVVASAITANVSSTGTPDEPIVVEFEPITVIGHRGDAHEHLAQSSTSLVN